MQRRHVWYDIAPWRHRRVNMRGIDKRTRHVHKLIFSLFVDIELKEKY